MSETAVYEPPLPLGDTPCACAVAAVRTNPADMTHPVNSFITHRSCHAPTPRAFSLFVPAGTSLLNPAVLGPDRGAFASNPGRADRRRPGIGRRATGDFHALVC